MKKIILLAIVTIMVVAMLPGCEAIGPNDPALMIGDNTQTSPSSIEYGIYVNKQITVYINQLVTHMNVMANVEDGLIYENEQIVAEESLKILQDIYDEVSLTKPPVDGEDDKDTLLVCMSTAIGHMEDYINALKSGGDISGYANDFQNDIYGLTNMANLYYE